MTQIRYLIDMPHRILWVPIRKCASHSVAHAGAVGKTCYNEEARYYSGRKDITTIAVIRHPYNRIVAALWTVLRDAKTFSKRLAELITERPLNAHIAPYSQWLDGIETDYVLRTERLQDNWNALRQIFPHLTTLPHMYKGAHRPQDWRGEYDWDSIYPVYREDFERFGYGSI